MPISDYPASLHARLPELRVLVVDRHTASRDSLRTQLGELGISHVTGVGTAADVLREVRGGHFDLIISDYFLSDGRDGQQLLEELRRARLIGPDTVYLIVTGERGYTNVVSLAELGPDDYLIKPFTADQLQSRLLRAFNRKFALHDIHAHLRRGRLREAIAACDLCIARHDAGSGDALRMKGELLNSLGLYAEAEAHYRQILASRNPAWAILGLATARKGGGQPEDALQLASQLIREHPEYLGAYDFLADLHLSLGQSGEAQAVLQQGLAAAPHNTARQRQVGDLACQNKDMTSAERAYAKVLERNRGSSLHSVDDYANLSRVLVNRGSLEAARKLMQDMKRHWRGHPEAELAALTTEARCLCAEGMAGRAGALVDQALALHQRHGSEADASPRLAIDLANACLGTERTEAAQNILRQAATENHGDPLLTDHIRDVYQAHGQSEAGLELLASVDAEMIRLNNEGVLAARSGDLAGAVDMLCRTADQAPNVQFLINAAKAIFTYLDRQGWDDALGQRGLHYLERAADKDRNHPKLASARELYASTAAKYGIDIT